MQIQRRKECSQKKSSMTKSGWAFFGDLGGKGESLTVPQLPILGCFAKLCSDRYKDVLISGLCPKQIYPIRERVELPRGLRFIRNHESSLALALGTTKGTAVLAPASELGSG